MPSRFASGCERLHNHHYWRERQPVCFAGRDETLFRSWHRTNWHQQARTSDLTPRLMYDSRHYPEYLQFFRIEGKVRKIHRQQGDTRLQLEAFNREFAVHFRDDNITLLRLFGFVDNHQVAGVQAHIFH